MKSFFRNARVLNLFLVLLMSIMLILQFLPFWQTGGTTCSIQRMLWFPNDQPEIEHYISAETGIAFDIDSVVWLTLGTFLCCVLGTVFCLRKQNAFFPSIFPALGGLMGVWNYLSRPALQIGSLWMIHLLIAFSLLIVGLYTLITGFIASREAG